MIGEAGSPGPAATARARDLYRQVLALRELLEAVARELGRLAASEPNPALRDRLLRRAQRWAKMVPRSLLRALTSFSSTSSSR